MKEFERATDRLRRDYKRGRDVTAQAQDVLYRASCISAFADPCALCPEAVADWAALRSDLDLLASYYGMQVAWSEPGSFAQPAAQPVIFIDK